MIGVLCNADEVLAAREFFELFKTSWELYEEGRRYDAVLTTGRVPAAQSSPVLLIYTSRQECGESVADSTGFADSGGAMVGCGSCDFPVYGRLAVFQGNSGKVILEETTKRQVAGYKQKTEGQTVYRFGYDLFREVQFLLTTGQPVERARVPTLDLHIKLLRGCLSQAGVSFIEILPVPAGYRFVVCLTHDIDFLGIRNHRFDHTMWGFLYRATFGTVQDWLRGRMSLKRVLRNFRAAFALPLVHLGLARDFWESFEWYLRVEKGLPTTYFLIPFKHRAGHRVSAPNPARRAAPYDVADIPEWIKALMEAGSEAGVHGIDAWHDSRQGRDELERVGAVTGRGEIGVRIHWLLRDEKTYAVLEEAGYHYDSTAGYNETVGYRCGTGQPFQPLGVKKLMELPLHIQDGALFYRGRLDLSENAASEVCHRLVENASEFGGVLTMLWHDRSPGPERWWGEFYVKLLDELKSRPVWFASAGQAVNWFHKRRAVSFQGISQSGAIRVKCNRDGETSPPMVVRQYRGAGADESHEGGVDYKDFTWNGESEIELFPSQNIGGAVDAEPVRKQAKSGRSSAEVMEKPIPS